MHDRRAPRGGAQRDAEVEQQLEPNGDAPLGYGDLDPADPLKHSRARLRFDGIPVDLHRDGLGPHVALKMKNGCVVCGELPKHCPCCGVALRDYYLPEHDQIGFAVVSWSIEETEVNFDCFCAAPGCGWSGVISPDLHLRDV